jgi:hypothetical protein
VVVRPSTTQAIIITAPHLSLLPSAFFYLLDRDKTKRPLTSTLPHQPYHIQHISTFDCHHAVVSISCSFNSSMGLSGGGVCPGKPINEQQYHRKKLPDYVVVFE